MTREELDEWYDSRLSTEELEKYNEVCDALQEATGDEDPAGWQGCMVMNAFHENPDEPVDVDALLEKLGVSE